MGQSTKGWSKSKKMKNQCSLTTIFRSGLNQIFFSVFQGYSQCLGVLVLAAIIFFIVASMGLCFGFVLETVLITQGCFSCCWAVPTQSQGLFCFSTPPHQRVGWGCTRSWEGTQLGQLTPTDQRDIPYHMTSWSAYKAGGRRRKGGTFGVMAFCLPK